MENRRISIKLKKFTLKIKDLSNIELLEEYRKSNNNIDYAYETGFSDETEHERNSILQIHILNRMVNPKNTYHKPPINREPKPTPAPPPKTYQNN